ncbi:hypothetical protein JRO89_XS02G0221800 [Xanthoceras sorbifolium]|uniref:Cysteine protease n=1 Tax=Xanthoceras sorbifolium TaxID=99658 RepID=A0ABQ8IGM4_9ROSI|nr:hypothetical protein JRO89_XS02G0221800 [Xanthoceras sorbifolium]
MANYSLFTLFLFLVSFISTAWTTSRHELNNDPLIRQVVSSDGLDDHMSLSKFEHQFSDFKKTYNKVYDTEEENEYRFGVFMSNLLRARRHQKLDPSAKHGITKFSDLTPSEFHDQFLISEKLQRPNLPNTILNAPVLSTNDLATQIDWRDRGAVTRVKDQGSCKASWAFSVAGILEAVHYQSSYQLVDLSVQQILDCDSTCFPPDTNCDAGCVGGYTYNALNYLSKAGGIMAEFDYPFTGTSSNVCQFSKDRVISSISKMFYISNNEDQIAAYVAKRNPVVVFVNSQYLQSYKSGVYCPSQCVQAGSHGALVVGYDVGRNWTLKNSWGTNWGESGYFRLCKSALTCTDQVDPIALTVAAD